MQIAKSTDQLAANSVRLADLGDYMIINGVPYDKKTNTPIPFNIVNIPAENYLACGEGMDPIYRKSYLKSTVSVLPNSSSLSFYLNCCFPSNYTFKNTLVDNEDSNIIWICPAIRFGNSITYTSENSLNDESKIKLYKIIKNKTDCLQNTENVISKEISISDKNSYNKKYATIYKYCEYMTQNKDFIFCVVYCFDLNASQANYIELYTASVPYIIKVNKRSLDYTVVPAIPYNSNLNNLSTGCYSVTDYSYNTIKILYENSDGFLYAGHFREYSNSDMKQRQDILFYSFSSGTISSVVKQGDTLPYDLKNSYVQTTISSSTTPSSRVTIYSNGIENTNEIYSYLFDNTTSPSNKDIPIKDLFKVTVDKSNLLSATYTKLDIIFPEGSEITSLPYNTAGPQYIYNYVTNQNQFVYKTICTSYNGKDYIHLFYLGYLYNPDTQRGIYTFEINENKTIATFVSFYPGLGGTLLEVLPLTEDHKKIAIATGSSYHFLKFDETTKKWVSTFDSMIEVKSMIKTKEDKIYVITADDSIICNDLNGAVILDFDFEKQSYNYNNADIDSYITIWAKNSDDEYVTSDVKLTIIGNCVWKTNGLQTLETKTNASGPINIPFTIKGQTSINVSVDAIV